MGSTESVRTFDIEGQVVRCVESGGDRLWRCECEYFQRMLTKHGQGFCPHVVAAIDFAANAMITESNELDPTSHAMSYSLDEF